MFAQLRRLVKGLSWRNVSIRSLETPCLRLQAAHFCTSPLESHPRVGKTNTWSSFLLTPICRDGCGRGERALTKDLSLGELNLRMFWHLIAIFLTYHMFTALLCDTHPGSAPAGPGLHMGPPTNQPTYPPPRRGGWIHCASKMRGCKRWCVRVPV